MTETPLDHAYAQMQADPDAQMLRLRFYDRLLGAELFVLLERPMAAGQDRIEPKILTSEGVSFVLAFDREERLSQFVDGTEAPYAALTGRALAKMLAPQDIGLGLNLGVAPSEILLDGAAMIWLRDIAEQGPTSIDARPVALNAPRGLPQDVLIALDAKLAGLTGLAAGANIHRCAPRGAERTTRPAARCVDCFGRQISRADGIGSRGLSCLSRLCRWQSQPYPMLYRCSA